MTEINAEKNGGQSEVLHPSSIFPFLHSFQPYADHSRDRRSQEAILKIVQSGHGLSLRLSMGDVCSEWWAPVTTQVAEMSVNNNSLPKDYPHPDNQAKQIITSFMSNSGSYQLKVGADNMLNTMKNDLADFQSISSS